MLGYFDYRSNFLDGLDNIFLLSRARLLPPVLFSPDISKHNYFRVKNAQPIFSKVGHTIIRFFTFQSDLRCEFIYKVENGISSFEFIVNSKYHVSYKSANIVKHPQPRA